MNDFERFVVRCRDCIFYTKPHIEFRDGTKKFFDSENEIEFVPADVGMNVGGTCVGIATYCATHDREDPEDNQKIVVFRRTNDFCSYGRRKKGENNIKEVKE